MLSYHRKLLSAVGENFPVQAVVFDGSNDYLTRGADLTGNANGKSGILSFWIKFNGGNATNMCILSRDGTGVFLVKDTGNLIEITIKKASGNGLVLRTSSTYTDASGWLHCLLAWDLANTTGYFYVNDADDTDLSTAVNENLIYTGSDYGIGANVDDGSTKLNADLAEFYFNNEAYLDISQAVNRRKFISAAGKPVNLGDNGERPTAATPRVYLSSRPGDAASAFSTNKGDGGNFSITGTLTIASTSPSD